jgi:hypothetical protein
MPIDASLMDWEKELAHEDWAGILIGNGSSQAVWERFGYHSLYQMARSDDGDRTLCAKDVQLFEAMKTENFERVLSALATTRSILSVLGHDTSEVDERYRSIREALAASVHRSHIPWSAFSEQAKALIKSELRRYQYVYSTNYDLLVYWSLMCGGPAGFKDYFWPTPFEISSATSFERPGEGCDECVTLVHFLHGGLHLYRNSRGQTEKRAARGGLNLLELFETCMADGEVPLLVAEGNSADKMAAIRSSDYLGFSYSRLASHKQSLVVFGHSLSPSDDHIAEAIQRANPGRIAVSLLVGEEHDVIGKKASVIERLGGRGDVDFFDAATHPLGKSSLRMDPL